MSNSTSSEESEDELETASSSSGKLAMDGGGKRSLVSSIRKEVSGISTSELTEGERLNRRRNQLVNRLAILHKLRTDGGGAEPIKAEPDTSLYSLILKNSLAGALGNSHLEKENSISADHYRNLPRARGDGKAMIN